MIEGRGDTDISLNGESAAASVVIALDSDGRVPEKLTIEMKGGRDAVEIYKMKFDGQVDVDLGAGNDAFTASFSGFNTGMSVKGGAGSWADALFLFDVTAEGDLTLDTGATSTARGVDQIEIEELRTASAVELKGQGGVTNIRLLNDADFDVNRLRDTLTISTGSGEDTVEISATEVDGLTTIATGGRRDRVKIHDNSVMNDGLKINTAGGIDGIRLMASEFYGVTTIIAGSGNDIVDVPGNDFADEFRYSGGGGRDTYNNYLTSSYHDEGTGNVASVEYFNGVVIDIDIDI